MILKNGFQYSEMKTIKCILLFACIAVSVHAKLYVYDLNGTAECQRNKEWTSLYKTAELQESDVVRTQQYSSMVILDDSRKKLYSVQSSEPVTVKQLINQDENSVSLLKEAFAGIFSSMSKENSKSVEHYQQRGGVTYRGDNEDRAVAMALTNICGSDLRAINNFQSGYPMELRLVNVANSAYTQEVAVGTVLVAEIENRSNKALYVNLLDIDVEGNKTILFPIDEELNMLHLVVPAYSTVRFNGYPIVIYEPEGVDHIIAVAYPQPFNMQRVLDMLPLKGSTTERVGVCNKRLLIAL